jgi:hypothetical protein
MAQLAVAMLNGLISTVFRDTCSRKRIGAVCLLLSTLSESTRLGVFAKVDHE